MLSEWIAGEDAEGEHYLIHTKPPRFIARLADDEPETYPQIELSSGEVLCDFIWIDPEPDDLRDLAEAANEALEDLDDIAIREVDDRDNELISETRRHLEVPKDN